MTDASVTPKTIPLALLADAWQTDQEMLAAQLGDAVVVDCLRVKHVGVQDACKLLEKLDAEAARHRAATEARNAELAQQSTAQLARVKAIQAQQLAQRACGQIDSNTSALIAMTMNDSNDRLEAKGRLFDELFNAGRAGNYGTLYKFNPHHQEA